MKKERVSLVKFSFPPDDFPRERNVRIHWAAVTHPRTGGVIELCRVRRPHDKSPVPGGRISLFRKARERLHAVPAGGDGRQKRWSKGRERSSGMARMRTNFYGHRNGRDMRSAAARCPTGRRHRRNTPTSIHRSYPAISDPTIQSNDRDGAQWTRPLRTEGSRSFASVSRHTCACAGACAAAARHGTLSQRICRTDIPPADPAPAFIAAGRRPCIAPTSPRRTAGTTSSRTANTTRR